MGNQLTLHQTIRQLRTEEDARVIDILFHLHLGMNTREAVATTVTDATSWFSIPGTSAELGVLQSSLTIQLRSRISNTQLAYQQVPSNNSLLYWHAAITFLATLRKVGAGY